MIRGYPIVGPWYSTGKGVRRPSVLFQNAGSGRSEPWRAALVEDLGRPRARDVGVRTSVLHFSGRIGAAAASTGQMTRRILLVLFLGQAGCTDDDDDGLAGATTGASGSMTSPGGESSGEASGQDSGASTGAGGSTSGADATDAASTDLTSVDGSSSDGPAPTGDLWVDETGAVIGLYELLIFGSATEVLVQLDADITWVVSFDHLSLGPVLNFGNFFYESTDCTGPGLIASTPGGDVEGLVIGAHDVDDELFTFVVPDGLEVSEGEFG